MQSPPYSSINQSSYERTTEVAECCDKAFSFHQSSIIPHSTCFIIRIEIYYKRIDCDFELSLPPVTQE